jgi:hypothetical protein
MRFISRSTNFSSVLVHKAIKITLLLLIVLTPIYSQNSAYTEVIYLKNGSVIKGIIIEQIPNDKIKIETRDGNIFVYTYAEIEKIAKETSVKQEQNVNVRQPNNEPEKKSEGLKESGYFNATELFIGFGIGNARLENSSMKVRNASRVYGVRTTHGYYLNKHAALGIGLGFEAGNYATILPLYLDCRFPFGVNSSKISFNMAVGTAFTYAEPTFILNPSVGLKQYLGNKASINISIGTNSRTLSIYDEKFYPSSSGYQYSYVRRRYFLTDLLISLGFSF